MAEHKHNKSDASEDKHRLRRQAEFREQKNQVIPELDRIKEWADLGVEHERFNGRIIGSSDDERIVAEALGRLLKIRGSANYYIRKLTSNFNGSNLIFCIWLSLLLLFIIRASIDKEGTTILTRAVNRHILILYLCFLHGLFLITKQHMEREGFWNKRKWYVILVIWYLLLIVGLIFDKATDWLTILMCLAISWMLYRTWGY